jgi:hypothetical protein
MAQTRALRKFPLGIQLLLVVGLVLSQGCGDPPPAQPAPGQPGAPVPGAPGAPVPGTPGAPGTTTPGALAVAITSAIPTKVDGNVTNAALPATINASTAALRVDLISQDGTTILGTTNPAPAAAAGATQPFSIVPTGAIIVGQTVSVRATQTYTDPATPTAPVSRTATSSPVQVTATPTTPPTTTAPVPGTTTPNNGTISIMIAQAGNSVAVTFGGFPANAAIQTSLSINGGAAVAGQALTANASGGGQSNVAVNPAVGVGQTLKVTLTGPNGQTVSASQTSDGR